jgi:hypothetical protein
VNRTQTPMTKMSDLGCEDPGQRDANPPTIQRSLPLARALHGWLGFLSIVSIVTTGCIIPPSLAVDNQDAGIDSPPAITSVRSTTQELDEPGPVEFVVAPAAQDQSIDLSLIDSDVDDTLYVRVFVNYFDDSPTAPRATCTAATTGTPVRTTTCNLQALCLQADIGNANLWMEIVVFDRPVLDAGTPPFKAMAPGGLSTDRTYNLLCEAPPPT